MSKYVIWGCGINGLNIFDMLSQGEVAYFVDANIEKFRADNGLGIDIISPDEYFERKDEYTLILSMVKYQELEKFLVKKGISNYLIFAKEKVEWQIISWVYDGRLEKAFELDKAEKIWITSGSIFSDVLYNTLLSRGYAAIYDPVDSGSVSEKDVVFDINGTLSISGCRIITGDMVNDLINNGYKKDIARFKNRHKGEICIIMGTGPSLRVSDLDRINKAGIPTIACNRIYKVFPETEWRPTYYVHIDGYGLRLFEQSRDHFSVLDGLECFMGTSYAKIHEGWLSKKINRLKTIQGYFPGESRFSDDCSKGVYSGGGVIFCCIQLAKYMGFEAVYLIGCDSNNDTVSNITHFYKDDEGDELMYTPMKSWEAMKLDYTFERYRYAREAFEKDGKSIYNATRGGKLEVFERVSLDALLEKYNVQKDIKCME